MIPGNYTWTLACSGDTVVMQVTAVPEGDRNHAQARSHDTSRISWAKLIARIAENFPLACPGCGGHIRLIGNGRQEPAHFEPEVRKRKKARRASPASSQPLTHLGEPLEPPPLAPARGPPTKWDDLMQVHDDHDAIQASPDDLPVIDIRRLCVLRIAPPNGPLRRRPPHSVKNRSLSSGWGSVATTNREPPQPALTRTPNSSTGRPPPLACGSPVDRPIL